jgi:hypothetical protein
LEKKIVRTTLLATALPWFPLASAEISRGIPGFESAEHQADNRLSSHLKFKKGLEQ